MEIFEAWPAALLVASGLLGLVIGSFLNVVAHRLPIMLEREWRAHCEEMEAESPGLSEEGPTERYDLWWPPSACPGCGHAIAAWQNIPVLSFVLLRGRCAHCARPISWRYPVVEAFTALASVAVAAVLGPSAAMLAALVFTWFLIALTLIDLDRQLLPDDLTLPLLWIGLVISLVELDGGPIFADLRASVIGAAAGYLALWTVFQLFKLVTGKEGMGAGDFKLLAALGAWLGWQMLPLVIVLSAAVGSVVGIGMIVLGRGTRETAIPFGPYLAGAGWISLLFGREIMTLYFQFVS